MVVCEGDVVLLEAKLQLLLSKESLLRDASIHINILYEKTPHNTHNNQQQQQQQKAQNKQTNKQTKKTHLNFTKLSSAANRDPLSNFAKACL